MGLLDIRELFVDKHSTPEAFASLLAQRGHAAIIAKMFKGGGTFYSAKLKFQTPQQCKDARFDLGGLVINGRKLWAGQWKDHGHVARVEASK